MILCLALSLVGVALAMIGRKIQPAAISDQPPRTA
jgi:hypothetical protein